MTDAKRLRAIRAIYERLPRLKCAGKCSNSCGPIAMSDVERRRVESRAGKRCEALGPGLTCSLLTPSGWCSVYGDRPLICRMWGVVESMPCPHGCRPEGGLMPDGEAFELMLETHRIGGGEFSGVAAGVVRELMKDPQARAAVKDFARRGREFKSPIERK